MATTKNIYFRDNIADKLKEVENLSELINKLLEDYFRDTQSEDQVLKEVQDQINLKEIQKKRREEFKINFWNNHPNATEEEFKQFLSNASDNLKSRLGILDGSDF